MSTVLPPTIRYGETEHITNNLVMPNIRRVYPSLIMDDIITITPIMDNESISYYSIGDMIAEDINKLLEEKIKEHLPSILRDDDSVYDNKMKEEENETVCI